LLTYLLIRLITYLLTHSLTYSLTYLLTYCFDPSVGHLQAYIAHYVIGAVCTLGFQYV